MDPGADVHRTSDEEAPAIVQGRCLRREWTSESGSEEEDGTAPSDDDLLAVIAQLIAASPIGTIVVDQDARVRAQNEPASTILNVHPEDLANSRFPHPIDCDAYELVLGDGAGNRRTVVVENQPLRGLDGRCTMVTLRPKGDRGDSAPGEVAEPGSHDPLTGLPTRELLLNRVFDALRRYDPDTSVRSAVVALDLERFESINSWYGVTTGDHVLRTIANRLTASVRPGDYVSRTGGDEFAVLLAPGTTARHLEVADRLATTLGQPIEIDGDHLLCPLVLGVAELVDDDDELTALAAAQEAAQHAVPGTPRLARRQLESIDSARSRALRASIPRAVSQGEMFLNYQPIFSLGDNVLVGMEALVRWEHPDDGLIAPDEFISIADESGAIVGLGEWVISEVCEQIVSWRAAEGYEVPPVHINVTSRQLAHPNFRHHALYELATRQIDTDRLRFEVTEDSLDERNPHLVALLRQLADDGFGIELDSFGDGQSSLTQLQQSPVATIKLTRHAVKRMMDDESSAKTVLAGIEVGRALGIKVTATGVETQDQRAVLERWNCDAAQGYLLARPLNPIEAARFFPRDPDSLVQRAPGQPLLRSGSGFDPSMRTLTLDDGPLPANPDAAAWGVRC
jgi:diguanylate cyclase (GGDEF)-like protein